MNIVHNVLSDVQCNVHLSMYCPLYNVLSIVQCSVRRTLYNELLWNQRRLEMFFLLEKELNFLINSGSYLLIKKLWYFTKIVRQFENRSSAHNNIPNFYFYCWSQNLPKKARLQTLVKCVLKMLVQYSQKYKFCTATV